MKDILDRGSAEGPQASSHKLDGHRELEQGEGGGVLSRASDYRQGLERYDNIEREERKPSVKERLEEILNKPREKLEIEDEKITEREINREVDRDRGEGHSL